MDCREFQKFVHVYLDGEFDDRDRGEIEGHLRECDPCRDQARFERWFRDGVKKSLSHDAPPADLAARIRSQLAKAPPPRSPALRGFAGPIAAMLVLGVLIGYIWSLVPFGQADQKNVLEEGAAVAASLAPQPSSRRAAALALAVAAAPASAPNAPSAIAADVVPASATATNSVLERATRGLARRIQAMATGAGNHDGRVVNVAARAAAPAESFGERDIPMQFASSDPDRVRAFLEQRIQKPITLPRFRGRARMVGGGAAENDATAQVVYNYKGDELYLQIRQHRDPTLPRQGIVVRSEGGQRVAAWQKDGVTYSMTSRLDPVEMVRLVAAEISQPRQGAGLEMHDAVASEPSIFGVTQPVNYSEARPVSFSQ